VTTNALEPKNLEIEAKIVNAFWITLILHFMKALIKKTDLTVNQKMDIFLEI